MAEAKPAVPRKRLTVTYGEDSKQPIFKFEGVWVGFDISTVASNLRREYLRVKRDQRRAAASETVSTPAKEES
jgi:hypothetical protein